MMKLGKMMEEMWERRTDGSRLGSEEGAIVGIRLGETETFKAEGDREGNDEGKPEGEMVGKFEGSRVGERDGRPVGDNVG